MATTRISPKQVSGQRGFSATELIIVVAVIGILMAASMPLLFSAIRTSAVKAGAEQMATVLGQARQMAIRDNTSICVATENGVGLALNGRVVRYRVGAIPAPPPVTCVGGTLVIEPGMEGNGFIRLANNIEAWPPGQGVLFTYIGTATAPATFTVRNPQDGSTLTVSVAPSGRISIGP
jgi:prepilin-type N-terminal cleavage/methylation domain-containing protein